ncbi:thiamine diphosphokinase [Traorella massiliensis]|uniref:thiamine diphosphokinase n=1 Tax=Traorella massiliensis TaxID=1903263 RepID=UPI0023522630|nr:thiamine diphosphokinase [Traorella massiliensis]
MNKRCILIGAGEMKEKNISLEKNDFVIAVDGGYQYCLNLNIHPDLVVSDFDSYPHEIKGIEILRSQPEKDDTDMMLAILAGLERGYDEFVIYGGMGGRLEHTLGNIQCLNFLCQKKAHGIMISQNSRVEVLGKGSRSYDASMSGYISIFSLADESVISIENLKYSLDHKRISNATTLGVDNEFIGKESKITLHEGCICIVITEG